MIGEVFRTEVGGDDDRQSGAVSCVDDVHYLLPCKVRIAFRSQIVDDEEVEAVEVVEIFLVSSEFFADPADDTAEIGHQAWSALADELVGDACCEEAFAGAYLAAEEQSGALFEHGVEVRRVLAGDGFVPLVAVVGFSEGPFAHFRVWEAGASHAVEVLHAVSFAFFFCFSFVLFDAAVACAVDGPRGAVALVEDAFLLCVAFAAHEEAVFVAVVSLVFRVLACDSCVDGVDDVDSVFHGLVSFLLFMTMLSHVASALYCWRVVGLEDAVFQPLVVCFLLSA